ncbi:hypothetical protein F4604DRAFT_1932301 [Suillus subluteus]|nr:hypothetical protein F4604DRAFT_1932301 [Suillus subluteus]
MDKALRSPLPSTLPVLPPPKPTHPAEDDQPPSLEPPPVERSPTVESPPMMFSFSLLTPHAQAWHSNPATPTEILPHIHPVPADLTCQDNNDLPNARRGSLPITMFTPSTDANQPSAHFPDRRKSMDVGLIKLMHHTFARVAKEKNDAIFLSPPIPPAGSGQVMACPPSGLSGSSTCATSYGSSASYSPYPRPLAHRASEPHVFTPSRSSLVPDIRPPFPSSHVPRRLMNNRFTMSSRALPSPFDAPISASPLHVSPDAESPRNMHAWAFPRNEADQDTEDSYSSIGLSRFGPIASFCGSDTSATSAIYSDVSSCVAVDHFDPNGRRGSCASNLGTRMSGLNMRSSQGSLNEAHLNAASSSVSPAGSPHPGYGKDPGPSGL